MNSIKLYKKKLEIMKLKIKLKIIGCLFKKEFIKIIRPIINF